MVNSDEKSPTDTKVHGTRSNMQYVLKSDLEEAINTAVLKIQESMIENLRPINEALARLESNVSKNTLTLEQHDDDIGYLKSENVKLKQTIDELMERVGSLENVSKNIQSQSPEGQDSLTKELDRVKERLEERTNKQLHQTLVIKGVKELPKETWEQTKQLLASTISQTVETSYSNAYQLLNRVHRGRPSENPNKRGQRDIYANLFSWSHCEQLVDDFRKLNVRGQTNRRIQAVERRKCMKDAGNIVSGYVAYPARLMAKTVGSSEYRMVEGFSSVAFKDFKPRSEISTASVHGANLLPPSTDAEPAQQSGWSNSELSH